MIEGPWDRWTDFVFLTGWFFAAALVIAAGAVRLHLRRRKQWMMLGQDFGVGLDPDAVERLLVERYRPPVPPVPPTEA
jgi:hypothetical protein